MARTADIGSKKLISLAPTAWVRWLLQDDTVEVIDMLAADLQWVSRETDALLRVYSPVHGGFLVLNEIQLRPDRNIGRRVAAYAALAHDRYQVPVVPVVVNILPPADESALVTRFEYEFLGLVARQDFRLLNLWEVPAELALQQSLLPLLPFIPILKGGDEIARIERALSLLRTSPEISQLETLLAFFASFVLETDLVHRIMRWDMTVLRESPWYLEILQEGRLEGLQEGLEEGRNEGRNEGLEEGRNKGQREAFLQSVLGMLNHRFGPLPDDLTQALGQLQSHELQPLINVAIDITTLDEMRYHLAQKHLLATL